MSSEPTEPTFASPTPQGSLPPADLEAAAVPLPVQTPVPGSYGPPGAYAAPATVPGAPTPTPTSRSRRRAAVAVVAVAVLGVVAAAAALLTQSARERAWEPLPAALTEPTRAHAVQLVLGSCVAELPDDGLVRQVQAVPCAAEHEAQVVGRVDAAPDAVWPGEEAATARVARTCGPDLLGRAAREAGAGEGLRFVVWAPSEESWGDGDRAGLCLAASAEPRTGSLLD